MIIFPLGKLAPIFMRGKIAEIETKKPDPLEDPEKIRARKEFLMSGIPDELKRIIAVTAASTIEADHPPLPCPSHVQQQQDFPSSLVGSGLSEKIKKILSADLSDDNGENQIQLMWSKLGLELPITGDDIVTNFKVRYDLTFNFNFT